MPKDEQDRGLDKTDADKTEVLSNEDRRKAAQQLLKARIAAEDSAARSKKRKIIGASAAVAAVVLGVTTYVVVDKVSWAMDNAKHVDCDFQPYGYSAGADPMTGAPAQPTPESVKAAQSARRTAMPRSRQSNEGSVDVTFALAAGPVKLTLDRSESTCDVAAVETLVKQDYYRKTTCPTVGVGPRATFLMCGEVPEARVGAAATSFGPGWGLPIPAADTGDATAQKTYKFGRGTVAVMSEANASEAPNTLGSQIVVFLADTEIALDLPIIGKVDDDASFRVLDGYKDKGLKAEQPTPGQEKPQVGQPAAQIDVTDATIG